MSKYSVGIDLGTTNCVLAYADLESDLPQIELLAVEQITAPNQSESLTSLPSFLYLPTEQEQQSRALVLETVAATQSDSESHQEPVIGQFARKISAEQPERTIAAAKSWLCHSHVDRHAAILPWGAEPTDSAEPSAHTENRKLSPVDASRLVLRHLARCWNRSFPEHPLSEQLVTLTVPASFDVVARELTREAALAAGLPLAFILLEEPQAAVYHWLEKSGDSWRKSMAENDTLLVCDVGGGTTDLTFLRAEQEQGELVLRRLAVGEHLLVGGDNMDLALAHYAAGKFREKGVKLNPWQSISLWHACRKAKESLLAVDGKETETISVLGRGSKLIAGTISIEVARAEVQALLVDGFFPICQPDDLPVREPNSGFQEIGLPFESDTAITRHIAQFVANNINGSENNTEDFSQLHLLLNGGVFKAPALRERLHSVLTSWAGGKQPEVLGGPEDLDIAVARGAAFYGWTKQHGGMRIRGGTARSYYVGIESAGLAVPGMPRPLQAVCVVPFGMEEGSELDVPSREVGLVVGREVQFRFFTSSVRKEDKVGTVLRYWDEEELHETSPLRLTLSAEDADGAGFVPIHFHSRINELGVFELWCNSARDDQHWKLEFNVREDAEALEA